ncbi:hypothetical protein IW261DRAFT_1594510, partial [Armillaria novae-zelandiae]
MTSAISIREHAYPSNAELIVEGRSNAERHNIEAHRYAADNLSLGDKPSYIYRDCTLHVTNHNHGLLPALLASSPQIPHRLKNLTLSGSYDPHLSLAAILVHFTDGMTGYLNIHGLNLSLLDDYMYEGFLRLVGSEPGRSGAMSIILNHPTFRTIQDVARLLTRCRSAKTIKIIGKFAIVHGHLRMGEIFASNIQWAQRKVLVGREGGEVLFSIMLDRNILLDKLTMLVISNLSLRTMFQLREILQKVGPALRVLNLPLPPCDSVELFPLLDLSLNTSLQALTISHSLMAENPMLISLYIHQCLMTLLIPANRWRALSLRKFKLNVLMGFDQCIDVMNLGPIDALLHHSAPALRRLVIVLHVPDWSPDRMSREKTAIGRKMPLCVAKQDV